MKARFAVGMAAMLIFHPRDLAFVHSEANVLIAVASNCELNPLPETRAGKLGFLESVRTAVALRSASSDLADCYVAHGEKPFSLKPMVASARAREALQRPSLAWALSWTVVCARSPARPVCPSRSHPQKDRRGRATGRKSAASPADRHAVPPSARTKRTGGPIAADPPARRRGKAPDHVDNHEPPLAVMQNVGSRNADHTAQPKNVGMMPAPAPT